MLSRPPPLTPPNGPLCSGIPVIHPGAVTGSSVGFRGKPGFGGNVPNNRGSASIGGGGVCGWDGYGQAGVAPVGDNLYQQQQQEQQNGEFDDIDTILKETVDYHLNTGHPQQYQPQQQQQQQLEFPPSPVKSKERKKSASKEGVQGEKGNAKKKKLPSSTSSSTAANDRKIKKSGNSNKTGQGGEGEEGAGKKKKKRSRSLDDVDGQKTNGKRIKLLSDSEVGRGHGEGGLPVGTLSGAGAGAEYYEY